MNLVYPHVSYADVSGEKNEIEDIWLAYARLKYLIFQEMLGWDIKFQKFPGITQKLQAR